MFDPRRGKLDQSRPFGALMTPQDSHNVLAKFMEPAENVDDSLKGSYFESADYARFCAAHLFQMSEFDLPIECYEAIKRQQDAMCSVGGRSSLITLMGHSQLIAPGLLNVFSKGMRGAAGKIFSKVKIKGSDGDDKVE